MATMTFSYLDPIFGKQKEVVREDDAPLLLAYFEGFVSGGLHITSFKIDW